MTQLLNLIMLRIKLSKLNCGNWGVIWRHEEGHCWSWQCWESCQKLTKWRQLNHLGLRMYQKQKRFKLGRCPWIIELIWKRTLRWRGRWMFEQSVSAARIYCKQAAREKHWSHCKILVFLSGSWGSHYYHGIFCFLLLLFLTPTINFCEDDIKP